MRVPGPSQFQLKKKVIAPNVWREFRSLRVQVVRFGAPPKGPFPKLRRPHRHSLDLLRPMAYWELPC